MKRIIIRLSRDLGSLLLAHERQVLHFDGTNRTWKHIIVFFMVSTIWFTSCIKKKDGENIGIACLNKFKAINNK